MKTIIELAREAQAPLIHDNFLPAWAQRLVALVEAAQLERLTQGVDMPPMPRAFLCTKCGSRECQGDIKEKHPHCAKCHYLGFADDTGYTADQMRDYAAAAVAKKDAETALQAVSDFGQMQELLAERDTLKAENERLRADAARYQFIKNNSRAYIYAKGIDLDWGQPTENLDAAIDAALKGQP